MKKKDIREVIEEESTGLLGAAKDFFKAIGRKVIEKVEQVKEDVRDRAAENAVEDLKEYAALLELQRTGKITRKNKRRMRKLEGPDLRGSAMVNDVPYVIMPTGVWLRAESKETTRIRRRAQKKMRCSGGIYS